MKKTRKTSNSIYKQLAQAVGFIVSAFYLRTVLSQAASASDKENSGEILPMLPIWLLPVAGYALTWYRELPGIMLTTVGSLIWISYHTKQGNIPLAALFGIPFLATACLFWLHRRKQPKKHHK